VTARPAFLAAVLLTGVAAAGTVGGSPPASELPGLEVLLPRTGGVQALRDVLGGRPALVAACATYCAPCRAEVPVLARAASRWGDSVRVLALFTDIDDPERLATVVRDWGMEVDAYGVGPDQDAVLSRLLPDGLPATFAVRGAQVARIDRLASDADLTALVATHLTDAPPPGGRPAFVRYCASCHGEAADGHGPVAPALRRPPPDLRPILQRARDPRASILAALEGDHLVAAHGSSDLPVWGRRLSEPPPDDPADDPQDGPLEAIVRHLHSLRR